ncbi:MAG: Lrp/AsnC family transcriptional regulator [Candidatus Methanosuratincola sp.]|jgi:DNA-binding Lrp family transcriptional regulator|uniref:Lrp/AsnC family transcriptional regulator n=2 Tax=Candidatus Methanosuratincola (ex Vanwonterghem et al. 2016) TaxID=1915412 RepID=A0A7J3V0A8_9CREN|nr:Lrp/AsnC family transcriptional regulator [Candidatus Methanosuratincola sp.]RWX73758.1 MAG: Transcriptional regulator, AsnC family [Candidatus Methanosuratincola subterraneus]
MFYDEIDLMILRELQEDAMTSYRDIAEKLNLSVGTVHNRIKRLKEIGLIKSFSAIVDAEKLGYGLTAIVLMQVEGEKIVEVEEKLATSKSIIAVYDTTGEFDIIAIGKFKNREDLNTFIKEALKIQAIKRTVTSIALNVVKEDLRIKF